ncbi:MAG: SLBB domain-containing protein [Saprospiraceae bacterium]|nr:SLBB domain-containing protein [Saprospiraceae bacterium]
MKGNTIFLFFLLVFVFSGMSLKAQVPNLLRPAAQPTSTELQRRGITEQELQDRLLEKGIDLNDLQSMTAEQALQFQVTMEQTIAELEAEKGRLRIIARTDSTTSITPADSAGTAALPVQLQSSKPDTVFIPLPPPPGPSTNPLDMIYGQEIFRNKSILTYNKSENIKPPDTYILGVGDIVNAHVFGRSKADFKNLEISAQGFIQISNFPRIYIKGLTYQQAREVVRKTLSAYFTFAPNEFEMTVDYSREISISIFGEAGQIGTYHLPATNTAFNALVAAGGPNGIGSVRNIKLIRGNQVKQIDVYDFIANPAIAQNFYLEQNDIIHIPLVERVVAITGAVKRPMRYELIAGENLNQLISFAAGLREDAFLKSIQIKRFIDDKEIILDVPLRELMDRKEDFTLLGGDVVNIRRIPLPSEQVITIEGMVETPGTYQFIEGMKVSDLLDQGNLKYGAKTDLAFLMRMNEDGTSSVNRVHIRAIQENPTGPENVLLKARDKILIYSLSYYTDVATVSISGAVRQTISLPYDFNRNLRLSDVIIMAGGLVPDALDFGTIRRINKDNYLERDYIPFNSKQALANPGGSQDLLLEPNDALILYSDRSFYDEAVVSISGSVRRPGSFTYGPGLTLKDVVVLGGGFSKEAATNRIEIFRVNIDENQPTRTTVATLTLGRDVTIDSKEAAFFLRPFDQIQVRAVPQFELQQNIQINGEVLFPGTYSLLKENETITDVLKRAGGPTAEAFLNGATLYRTESNTGFIIFKMKDALNSPGSPENLILKNGDQLSIPKIIDFVTIIGATDAAELYQEKLLAPNNRINIAYNPGKNAKFYVDEYAAGVSRTGSKKRITVEQPNGRISRTKNLLLFKLYPHVEKGAVVKVGDKIPKDQRNLNAATTKKKVDWSKVLSETLTQATAVLSFILLIRALDTSN